MKFTSIEPQEKTEKTLRIKKIRAGVRFGSPKKNCVGSGICRVEAPGYMKDFSHCCNKAIADVSIAKNKKIQFKFLKKSISPTTKDKYFNTQEFIVEDNYSLPNEFTQKLKLHPIQIVKGIYAIQETEDYYLVECDSISTM